MRSLGLSSGVYLVRIASRSGSNVTRRTKLTIRIQVLVFCYKGQCHRFIVYSNKGNGCPSLLANPINLLLDTIWFDNAQADPVSYLLLLGRSGS